MSKQNPTRVMLKNARLAFPHLFEPQQPTDGNGRPRYNASFIIPPDHPQVDEIREAIKAAADKKWAGKGPKILEGLQKQDKVALHDGDTKEYDGFEGNLFVSAAAQIDARPTVVDTDRTPLSAEDGRIYAGCYVNASLEFWGQDNTNGKRVNGQIRGVQFARDGDAFGGGRPASTDEFDDVSDGADAGDDFGDIA